MKKIKLSVMLAVVAATFVGYAEYARNAISDVRVAPMLTTHWNQKSSTGYSNTGVPCYNYYTPNGYPVGCSATSLAQLMRYWQYPAMSPSVRHACQVDFRSTSLKTLDGAYDWANMIDSPAKGVTEAQCQAIGHLTYDCAVSLRSMFADMPKGTTAYVAFAFDPLVNDFGYANAIGYLGKFVRDKKGKIVLDELGHPKVDPPDPEAIRPTIFASLDAGAPVLMSVLTEDVTVHTVVVDGYGFEVGKPYVHLNFGLSNLKGEDAWYPLSNVFDAHRDPWHFTIIDGVVYNVFPEATGDVLSGRVTWADGTPAVGVSVQAAGGTAVTTVETDANGIYAFLLTGGDNVTYKVSVGRLKKFVQLPKSVSADCNFNESVPVATDPGALGNSWGNDFVVASADDLLPPEEDPLGGFNPKKSVSGVFPFCGVLRDASENPVGTMTLKVGKVSKKGEATVSATITTLEGKKFSMKSTKFRVTEDEASTVTGIVVKNFGTIDLSVGEKGFEAQIIRTNGEHQSAGSENLTAGLAEGVYSFHVDGIPSIIDGKEVLMVSGSTPEGEPVSVNAKGKWTLRKAGSLKISKRKVKDESGKSVYVYALTGLDDPKKPNCSGLKVTYTAKTGTLKGSFNLYCLAGTAAKPSLKKYTVSFSGLVIDGKGIGFAPAKKNVPAMSITIE